MGTLEQVLAIPCGCIEVGLKGVIFALAPFVLIAAIAARAGGQGESYLSWAVFGTLIIAGVLTALQASPLWRLGPRHVHHAQPRGGFDLGVDCGWPAIARLAGSRPSGP